MTRYEPDGAEQSFFDTLLEGGGSLDKTAVDLEPETAEALGVQTVSPSILENLEAEAAPTEESSEPSAESASPVAVTSPEPTAELEQAEEASQIDEEPEEERPAEPELPSRETHGKLFTNRQAHPLQIFDVLAMRYREQWVEWEPDTLWWALRRDFGPVGELARNKIQALSLAATTDMPWLDWDVFENSGLAWNDVMPLFGAFQPLTPMQVAFTVQVLRGVRADEDISHEVSAYMAAVLEEHGWVYAPEEWFPGAQEILDRRSWTVGFKDDVSNAWERVKDVPPQEIEWRSDDPLGIHLLKLAVVKQHLDERAALREVVPGISASAVTVSPPVP